MERIEKDAVDRRPLRVHLIRAIIFATVALVVIHGERQDRAPHYHPTLHVNR